MVSSILLPTTKSAEARYQLGLLVRDGMIPRKDPEHWSGYMMMAANCLHVPAIKEIIQDYNNRNYTLYVLRWLYVLEVMGYDVAQEIQEYDRKARNENPDYEGTVFDEDLVNGKSCIAESD